MATFNDQLASVFTATSTVTKSQLTPWSAWCLTSTVTTTVTTTVRVVSGVHNDTTNTWANTLTAIATSRTDLDVLVLDVTNHTESCSCFQSEAANFAGWETY